MNIAVFCSANEIDKKYNDAAAEFAALLARGGHTLVWGGSNRGTMKVIADSAQSAGGKIVGISVEFLKDRARPNADEMVITYDLAERKAMMISRSDAILVLPGGTGTLDEITEVLEYKKFRKYEKPVAFLNTDGFYAGFKMQLERMEVEGFLARPLSELAYFAGTPTEAMKYLESSV